MEIKLTEKERELIRLLSEKDDNIKEIARELLTTHKYIHQMLNGLYEKTGRKKARGLISWAYQNGVLKN